MTKTSLTFVLLFLVRATAQRDDPNAFYYIHPDCQEQTDALTIFPELRAEWALLADLLREAKLPSQCDATSSECTIDYALFPNNIEQACGQIGGRFIEKSQRIECGGDTAVDGSTTAITIQNMPMCMGNVCTPNLMEGITEGSIRLLEEELTDEFGVECSLDYEWKSPIRLPDNNDLVTQQCKASWNAAPKTCSSLAEYVEGWTCDCYSFCGNQLVGCTQDGTEVLFEFEFDEEELSCDEDGDIVIGCTRESLHGGATASSGTARDLRTDLRTPSLAINFVLLLGFAFASYYN